MGNGFKKAWNKFEKMGFGAVVKPNFEKFRDCAGAGSTYGAGFWWKCV